MPDLIHDAVEQAYYTLCFIGGALSLELGRDKSDDVEMRRSLLQEMETRTLDSAEDLHTALANWYTLHAKPPEEPKNAP